MGRERAAGGAIIGANLFNSPPQLRWGGASPALSEAEASYGAEGA